jgi:peptidoglycan-associated lipoprotein
MKKISALCFIALCSFSLAITGCGTPKKKTAGDAAVAGTDTNLGADGLALELNGDSDSNKAGALQTVYFDFNSAGLSSSTRSALDNNAKYLKANTSVEVQVEGHADERGGVQYNLALGERRAKAVRDYLVSMGVASKRISTISFGKERPISFGHDETSWSRNRRGNFVVTAK